MIRSSLPRGIFEAVTVKRTGLIGDALATVVAFLKGPDREPDDPIKADPDEDESTEVDWWQHYGFLSRPPNGAEALIARIGAQTFALASRYLAAKAFGKLNEGDVALYSVGNNILRLNANGSISMLAPDKKGKQMIMRLDPKGEITLMLGNGTIIQMSESSGISMLAQTGNITLAAPAGSVQVIAQALNNMSPVLKANAVAAKPLTPATALNPGIFV